VWGIGGRNPAPCKRLSPLYEKCSAASLLGLDLFCEGGVDHFAIWRCLLELTRLGHDFLQQSERGFLQDGIGAPGVDVLIPLHHGGEQLDAGIGEGGGHDFRHLPGGVRGHPLLPLIDGAGEAFDEIRVFLDIAFLGEIGGVGNFAALLADGGHDIALAFGLQHGGGGLEQGDVIPGAAGEGARHQGELDAVVQGDVLIRIHAVFADDVFERHIGHAALAAGQNGLAPDLIPGEGGVLFPAHQEGAVPLGHLGEDLGIVLLALVVHIDGGLGAGEADVDIPREDGGHDLIGPLAVGQLDVDALLAEKAQLDGRVLRGVEDGVGDLADGHLVARRFAAAASGQQGNEGGAGRRADKTPVCRLHRILPFRN